MDQADIRSFDERTDNAQLMLDCHRLGYLPKPVLDMTYGQARFWRLYDPWFNEVGWTNDLNPKTLAAYHYDFTDLPEEWTGQFASVVFDPPYKLNGTGGSHASDEGYGVADKMTVTQRMDLMLAGLLEANRVSNRFILMKCQDQVVNGRKRWQTIEFTNHAAKMGMRLRDMLHVQGYREQPAGKRQLHSRGDYSTLLVFEKRKK